MRAKNWHTLEDRGMWSSWHHRLWHNRLSHHRLYSWLSHHWLHCQSIYIKFHFCNKFANTKNVRKIISYLLEIWLVWIPCLRWVSCCGCSCRWRYCRLCVWSRNVDRFCGFLGFYIRGRRGSFLFQKSQKKSWKHVITKNERHELTNSIQKL